MGLSHEMHDSQSKGSSGWGLDYKGWGAKGPWTCLCSVTNRPSAVCSVRGWFTKGNYVNDTSHNTKINIWVDLLKISPCMLELPDCRQFPTSSSPLAPSPSSKSTWSSFILINTTDYDRMKTYSGPWTRAYFILAIKGNFFKCCLREMVYRIFKWKENIAFLLWNIWTTCYICRRISFTPQMFTCFYNSLSCKTSICFGLLFWSDILIVFLILYQALLRLLQARWWREHCVSR